MLTCSFTGHRTIPRGKIEYVRQELRREIELAVAEGFTRFISGFASGVDLEAAAIVAEMKRENPALFLEAAIPYRGRMKTVEPLFRELIGQCDSVYCECEEYAANCYFLRNYYLVKSAERVIAVFSGRQRSGTAQTMRLAEKLGCELRIIRT